MTTALLADQNCSAETGIRYTQPAQTRAPTSKTRSRPSQSASVTFAFLAPFLPILRVQWQRSSNGAAGQKTVLTQWQRLSNGAARPNHTTLTIRLTRNPACPNRWGSHERCRFIGGWRRTARNSFEQKGTRLTSALRTQNC